MVRRGGRVDGWGFLEASVLDVGSNVLDRILEAQC
jgi:hypothetical protein